MITLKTLNILLHLNTWFLIENKSRDFKSSHIRNQIIFFNHSNKDILSFSINYV